MSDQTPPQYPSYPGSGEQPATPPGYGPPPAAYGNLPPAYGASQYGAPTVPFASWWSRVGAYLLDGLIALALILVPLIAGLIIAFKDAETDINGNITGGVAPIGVLLLVLTGVIFFAFDIWNRGVRVGSKGQSFGKQIVGITTVRSDSGAFLGRGTGFLRWFMAFLLGAISCVQLLDVLWPLWDDHKQTLHDKIVGSVVLRK